MTLYGVMTADPRYLCAGWAFCSRNVYLSKYSLPWSINRVFLCLFHCRILFFCCRFRFAAATNSKVRAIYCRLLMALIGLTSDSKDTPFVSRRLEVCSFDVSVRSWDAAVLTSYTCLSYVCCLGSVSRFVSSRVLNSGRLGWCWCAKILRRVRHGNQVQRGHCEVTSNVSSFCLSH